MSTSRRGGTLRRGLVVHTVICRTWEVTLEVPRLEVVGTYTMSGQLFIDLGLSQGDET